MITGREDGLSTLHLVCYYKSTSLPLLFKNDRITQYHLAGPLNVCIVLRSDDVCPDCDGQ